MVLNSILKNGVKKKKKKAKKGYVFYSIGKPICVINGIISIKRQVQVCGMQLEKEETDKNCQYQSLLEKL